MTKELAINRLAAAINHYNKGRALRFAELHGGLDAKRPRAWCEFGYPDEVTFDHFYRAYDRDGLGAAAINLRADTAWQDDPWIAEGSDKETFDKDTVTEKKIGKHLRDIDFWGSLKLADVMRLVGGYSYVILRIADSQELSSPVKANAMAALVEIVPVWLSQVRANRTATGDITNYTYTEQLDDGNSRERIIHPDRIVVFGDKRNGKPMLKAGFNNLINLEKVLGGSAESLLKNAARQMNINFDSEVDLGDIAKMYGLDSVADLQGVMNDAARDLNTGLDVLMATQGAQVSPMTSAVADPTPSYNANLQAFAASVQTPVKVLVGNVTGERASTEDFKQFNATCQSWRIKEANKAIRQVVNRLIQFGMISFSDYTVCWTDLTEGTANEKADTSVKVAQVLQAYTASQQAAVMTGDDPLLSRDEMRNLLGLESE